MEWRGGDGHPGPSSFPHFVPVVGIYGHRGGDAESQGRKEKKSEREKRGLDVLGKYGIIYVWR